MPDRHCEHNAMGEECPICDGPTKLPPMREQDYPGYVSLALVRDIAENGLRFDTNPTLDTRDVGKVVDRLYRYIEKIDIDTRNRAKTALRDV